MVVCVLTAYQSYNCLRRKLDNEMEHLIWRNKNWGEIEDLEELSKEKISSGFCCGDYFL